MKKVLIVMATYNGEKYLREQINSILNQKNVKIQLLVRDDGSSDNTIQILDEYQHAGKLQWYNGQHINVARGYLNLMKKAADYDTDYISFSDQDDVWDLDKLFVAIQALEHIGESVPALYYCGQRLVDKNLKLLSEHILNDKRNLTTRFILSDFAGCTGVFNKSLLSEVLLFEPGFILMHDTWILKVCLALGGKVIVDSQVHMNYRQHGENTVGLGKSFLANVKQVKQYLNEYKVKPQMEELLKGYGNRMIPEYKCIAECVCDYRAKRSSKKRLLDKNTIDFKNTGLNLTYRLKIYLSKL